MAGWTPSLILLAWMLWRDTVAEDKAGDEERDGPKAMAGHTREGRGDAPVALR